MKKLKNLWNRIWDKYDFAITCTIISLILSIVGVEFCIAHMTGRGILCVCWAVASIMVAACSAINKLD